MPADLLIDTGHPAGLRMMERGGFGDPASPRRALLVECGQHWERAAADVAIDTMVRFLGLAGLADAAWVQANVRLALPPVQRLVRVTEPVVARSQEFRFLVPIVGLSVVPKAGTPIAQDGDHVWTTPYDDAVLVMPGTKQPEARRHRGAARALRDLIRRPKALTSARADWPARPTR